MIVCAAGERKAVIAVPHFWAIEMNLCKAGSDVFSWAEALRLSAGKTSRIEVGGYRGVKMGYIII